MLLTLSATNCSQFDKTNYLSIIATALAFLAIFIGKTEKLNKHCLLLSDYLDKEKQAIKSHMAQLYRFLNIDDRFKTEAFTFVLPPSFILDMDSELKSRDFTASNHKWSLCFAKTNGQLNVSLILKSITDIMTVTADFSMTLVNREHFTRNDTFVEKNFKFTHDSQTYCRKAFTSIEQLCTLDFMDERGCIQCELELRNVSTAVSYPTYIPIVPTYNRSPTEIKSTSKTFLYGNYEWNVLIQPKLDSVGSTTCLKFYMQRLTGLDHLCRIAYRFKLINGTYVHDSGIIEQYSDINGNSNSYRMDKIKDLLQTTGKFTVKLDMLKILSVFPVSIGSCVSNNSTGAYGSVTTQPTTFVDRDKQTWMMESYVDEDCFILRLFYVDINNIPYGYVRLMSFNISVRHQTNGPVYVLKKPIIKYYHKKETDDGLEITTTIDVNDVLMLNGGYLDQDGCLNIEIEYYYSHLLHQPEYSNLDDIIRKHKIQMLREIQTLQTENYSLEKQLHNYQQSISSNTSRPSKSFDQPLATTPTSMMTNNSSSSTLQSNQSASSTYLLDSASSTPQVVRKYQQQKYGNSSSNIIQEAPSPNQQARNASMKQPGNNTSQPPQFTNTFNSMSNNGITNLTSQLTSGLATLKLSASKIPTNKLTSKIINPFNTNPNNT